MRGFNEEVPLRKGPESFDMNTEARFKAGYHLAYPGASTLAAQQAWNQYKGEPISTPKDYSTEASRKQDSGKLRYDLIPAEPLDLLARIYTFGAAKYEDRGWEKGIKWSRIFGAIMRHLWAWYRGEDRDPESGLPHPAHAAWGCFALLEYARTKKELDDRPKLPSPVEKRVSSWTPKAESPYSGPIQYDSDGRAYYVSTTLGLPGKVMLPRLNRAPTEPFPLPLQPPFSGLL